MGIEQTHPDYDARRDDWTVMADCWEGQRAIKDKGTEYLPATSGQLKNGGADLQADNPTPKKGTEGYVSYQSYKKRALFPGYVREAVEKLTGIMHRKPATIEVPARLEPMVDSATNEGEGLATLLRRITEAQLLYGRYHLLVDVPSGVRGPAAVPFIAPYVAQSLRNWSLIAGEGGRQRLEFAVLDESDYERRGFEWRWQMRYRVLALAGTDGVGDVELDEGAEPAEGEYVTGIVREGGQAPTEWTRPAVGTEGLKEIPLVIVNANDLAPPPDVPPLLDLANRALAIYRGDADWRQALHAQSGATWVETGVNEDEQEDPRPVGPGARASYSNPEAEAKWEVPSAEGISAQREGLEQDHGQAQSMAGQLLDSRQRESGEALHIRLSSRTASLSRMAQIGAEALREALKIAARWVGADPEEVVVEPNMDFVNDPKTAKELKDLQAVIGVALSLKSVHEWAKRNEFTTMEYDEELEQIAAERMELGDGGATGTDIDPQQGDEDEEEGAA